LGNDRGNTQIKRTALRHRAYLMQTLNGKSHDFSSLLR